MSSPSPSCQQSPVPLTTEDELDLMMGEVTPELDDDGNDQAAGSGQQTPSPSRDTNPGAAVRVSLPYLDP